MRGTHFYDAKHRAHLVIAQAIVACLHQPDVFGQVERAVAGVDVEVREDAAQCVLRDRALRIVPLHGGEQRFVETARSSGVAPGWAQGRAALPSRSLP